VSSLRAQFENIGVNASDLGPSKALKPPYPTNGEQERGRSSLDIPRRASAWPGSSHSPPASRSPEPTSTTRPNMRQLTPGAASRQRPVSMGPWSPPQSPPALTLQSPASPPKPLVPAAGQFQGTPESSIRTFSTSSSQSPSSPTRQSSRILYDTPELALMLDRSRRPSPTGSRRPLPPPINRASKPATPTSSAFGTERPREVSKERLSPFSTPPSSDESSEKESSARQNKGFPKPQAYQNSYFPPPPVHHAVEARKEAAAAERTSRRLDNNIPNGSAFTRPPTDISDHPNQRPVLPSRPGTQVSPPRPIQQHTSASPSQPQRLVTPSKPPPRPSEASKGTKAAPEILPPPKRSLIPSAVTSTPKDRSFPKKSGIAHSNTNIETQNPAIQSRDTAGLANSGLEPEIAIISTSEHPDATQTNRRPPRTKCGVQRVWTQYDTRLFDLCGTRVCSGGYIFRAWDTTNSRMMVDIAPEDREIKITAFTFKPGRKPEEEGLYVWIGNNYGEIQELDLKRQTILESKSNAHPGREIVKMYRHQNSIWSLDNDGKLLVWSAAAEGVPSLKVVPVIYRLAVRGYSFSIVVKNHLWVAVGKNIQVYNPAGGEQNFNVTLQPLVQANAGDVTSGALLSNQLDKVYFGHSDGKISIYSTDNFSCLGLISASGYKINCLVGAGVYLWAGFNTGMIYVYDTQTKPWKIKKEWQAHQNPVLSIVVDLSSVWKFGHLQVASLGADNAICFWDGMLEDDWIGKFALSSEQSLMFQKMICNSTILNIVILRR
jgi:hypothetical protein